MTRSRRRRRPDFVAKRERREAYEHAQTLGSLEPVEPAGQEVDDFPLIDHDQAYAFPAGRVFHSYACSIVRECWDEEPPREPVVILRTAVGRRRLCEKCREESPV